MSSPSGTSLEWTQISSTRWWKTWPLDSSWTSLRYLATGNLYKSLAYGFWVIPNTIISVVLEVCHLWPLPQDSLQVSHNKRGVKGGSPGLQGQVELPSLLWLYRWQACEDASSISLWQSVLQLQRLLLHHHTGHGGCQLQVYVCGCGCLWCWLWCWNLQGVSTVSHGLYQQDEAGLPPSEALPDGDTDVPCFPVGDDAFAPRSWMMKPHSQGSSHLSRMGCQV